MKRFLLLCMMTMAAVCTKAQDVTTFLGIPVDGYKSQMRQKLIAKGYVRKQTGSGDEYFYGEFNGADVSIHIVTNNNKVYRLMVSDENTMDEANIKIRFNNLVSQFENNKRYVALDPDQAIPEDEDISYEMLAHDKIYEAVFYQQPDMDKVDTLALQDKVREELLQKYTAEQLENPTAEIQEELSNAITSIATRLTFDMFTKKSVWFRIVQLYGKFYINMYYDNEYNKANGEDL